MTTTKLYDFKEKKALVEKPAFSVVEIICIAGIFCVFLLLMWAFSPRFAWWQDEVMFVDPAINLYLGKGFTSTAWPFQSQDKFWAGNLPLYTILLYYWIKLFGFTAVAVRSLNYVLIVISGLMLWLSVARLGLVKSSYSRVALIAMFLLGEGMSVSYSTARYDCLGITLFAAALLVYSLQSIWIRCVLLAGIGIFIPMSGLHLIAYTILLGGLLLFYMRRLFLREVVSLALGGIVGILFVIILYSINGVLLDFLKATFAGGDSITGKIGQAIVQHDYKHLAEYTQILGVFFQDRSFLALLGLAIAIAFYQFKKGQFQFRSLLSFGLATAFCIPVGLFILGNYPIYYTWMAFIPLAICVGSTLDISKFNPKKRTHLFILGVITLTCLVGLPQKLAQTAYQWNARDYTPIEALVDRNVTKNDWVYSDYIAYYATKKKAAVVILPSYAKSALFKTIPEREKISVMIVQPKHFEEAAQKLGGKWYDTGDEIGSPAEAYNLEVFRRQSNF